jgi:hypothetical protein
MKRDTVSADETSMPTWPGFGKTGLPLSQLIDSALMSRDRKGVELILRLYDR